MECRSVCFYLQYVLSIDILEIDEGINEQLMLMIVLIVKTHNAPSKISSFMSAATHKEF